MYKLPELISEIASIKVFKRVIYWECIAKRHIPNQIKLVHGNIPPNGFQNGGVAFLKGNISYISNIWNFIYLKFYIIHFIYFKVA